MKRPSFSAAVAAMRFLTVFPIPGSCGTAAEDLAASTPFFPVVGIILGAASAVAAWGLAHVLPPLAASALMVVGLISVSGGLHLDGLADTADAFFSSRPREQMLEIMKDSRVGAMGVIAIVSVMLIKVSVLASLLPGNFWRAALLMPLAGRSALVWQMAFLPYVRAQGLGSSFAQSSLRFAAFLALAVLALTGWALLQQRGLCTAGMSALATLVFSVYCRRKIGGATGDTYGAGCEIAEIMPPLVLLIFQQVNL